MRKDAATKLVTLLMALLLVVTLLPAGNVTAQAASKKPGAVTKVTKSEVNPTTVTIAYNKAKNAKGYQIRAYKGKKLVKSAKTKDTSYTVKGLSAETKYTIKVRAYNGSKYGKEKSITVKTETKNLAVTGLRASNVTKDSVKITYKKAKNAKGYQIRVYKGSKQMSGQKTGKTSYTVSKLSGGTKYTIKVRAYNGKKYGKEKSITVTTQPATDNTQQTDDNSDTTRIVMPGESTSTGDALIAEYNAYVAYTAEKWKNKPAVSNPIGDELEDLPWLINLCHITSGMQFNTQYNSKYDLFKHKAGTTGAVSEMAADILNTMGIPAQKHDVANDVKRFSMSDTSLTDGVAFTLTSGNRYVIAFNSDFKGTFSYNLTREEKAHETWEIVAHCPHCGKELTRTAIGIDVYGLYSGPMFSGLDVTGTYTVGCGDRYGNAHECKPYKLPEHPGSDKFEMVTPNVRIAFQRTLTKAEMLASHRIELTEADLVYDDYMQQIPEGAIVE